MERIREQLAVLVAPTQVLFVAAFFAAAAVQPRSYSPANDDISDLGALTAHHPWLELAPSLLAGVVTIGFALLVLLPLVGGPGPVLLALSLMGLDNVTDPFFRLDCGRALPGCTEAVRFRSWHAGVHLGVGVLSTVATVAGFVALGRAFRRRPEWRDLALPCLVFAGLILAVMGAYAGLAERPGGGLVQRIAVLLLLGAFTVLAARARRLVRSRRFSPGDPSGTIPSP